MLLCQLLIPGSVALPKHWQAWRHLSLTAWPHGYIHMWDNQSLAFWHASPPLCPWLENEQLHHSVSDMHLQQPQQGAQEREVKLVWLGTTPTSTAGHLGSLLRSTLMCLPPDPAQRQVSFNLPDDLGNTLQLPTDMVSFLGEDATDEQRVKLNISLSPQAQAHWCCQRRIETSGIPPLLEEPCLRPAPPHWPGLWLPGGPFQMQYNTRPTGMFWGMDPGLHGQDQTTILAVLQRGLTDALVRELAKK